MNEFVSGMSAKLIDVLSSVISEDSTYYLLDFPDHSNVGDSAIFLGEAAALNSINRSTPEMVLSHKFDYNTLITLPGDGVILLHGGGNLGDIWPKHQVAREALIEKFTDRKIIQLPQSMHFSTEARLDSFARIIDSHKDITLLLRDDFSYSIAKNKFNCKVFLCPDAAYALGEQARFGKSTLPTLGLMRNDIESASGGESFGKTLSPCAVEDWLEEPKLRTKREKLIEYVFFNYRSSRRFLSTLVADSYNRRAMLRFSRGISQLSRAEIVVTDRLHAHIMCELLGIPHVVLDNSYGKISNFIRTWGHAENTKFATSFEDVNLFVDEFKRGL